jgi:hypothetical protein
MSKLTEEEKRERARESQRKWRLKNKEKAAEYRKKWAEKNAGKLAEYHREWKEKHPEKAAEMAREWRKKNPEKLAEYQRKWRAKNPEKAAESQKRWKEENPEKVAESRGKHREKLLEWKKKNPDKIAAYQLKAQRRRMVERLQSADGVRNELMKLGWFKEFDDTPQYPRGIANWAGIAIDRFDCEELALMLREQNTVMRGKRDTLCFYWADKCGRNDKPYDKLLIGWAGWIKTPKALDKLAGMFGLEPGDYSDLDWSVPEYPVVQPLKNFMGHDLTRIRLGDKWRGWKIIDRELHDWLVQERLRLSVFVHAEGWGVSLTSYEGELFSNFMIEWGAGYDVLRADLVKVVEWIGERMFGIPLNEVAIDPVLAQLESEAENQEILKAFGVKK